MVEERAAQERRVATVQVLTGPAVLGREAGYRNDPLKGSMVEEDGNCSHQVERMPGCTEAPAGVAGNAAEGILVEGNRVADILAEDSPAEDTLVAGTLVGGNPAQEGILAERTQAVGSLAGDTLVAGNLVAGDGSGEDYRSEDVPF